MPYETQDVERKTFSILRVLANSTEPLGSIVIARKLKDLGVDLGARAVRYHLKLTDEHGLTWLAGRRDGREITERGLKELEQGMVKDKIGFAISRIELLAFHTTYDPDTQSGLIPVNVSFIDKQDFQKAIRMMRPVFSAGLCVSTLVAIADSKEKLGDLIIPQGKVALATVCSVVINGALLKAGVPINSKFGGLLQMQDYRPLRFVELIHYDGCSRDPSEVFIKARMTSVAQVVKTGNGNVLANFREIPSVCRQVAREVITKLSAARVNGVLLSGNVSESVCEMPVELNKCGMVLMGGLNPVAAIVEAGIDVESHAMRTVVEYKKLVEFEKLLK